MKIKIFTIDIKDYVSHHPETIQKSLTFQTGQAF